MFGFNPTATHQQSGDLIPSGYACWGVVNVRGYKKSQKESSGHYLDIELTVADGQPFARRKLWSVVMDPSDQNNSEQGRQMGLAALQHMLESCGVFNPAQPATYQQFDQSGIQGIAGALHEKMVALVVGIEKGKDGYNDKNKVLKWLSPNSASPSKAEFDKLVQGGAVLPAPKTAPRAPAQPPFFGAAQPQHPVAQPVAQPQPMMPQPVQAGVPATNATPAWLRQG